MHFVIDKIIRNHQDLGLSNLLNGLTEEEEAHLQRTEPDFHRLLIAISRNHGKLNAIIHSYNQMYQIKRT
jgi:hypothetical protein